LGQTIKRGGRRKGGAVIGRRPIAHAIIWYTTSGGVVIVGESQKVTKKKDNEGKLAEL